MEDNHFRRQAKNKLLALLIVLAAVAVALWYFSRGIAHTEIVALGSKAGNILVQEITKDVSNPAPLIATGTDPSVTAGQDASVLTDAGVVAATNVQRKTNGGLAALSENALLDQIASERLGDMVAKQYFAHVSPSSSSAETVAQADGYRYIALGENLALGNFSGDAGVVAAWMGSPGHRANILNTHYTEIGVAVKQTVFNGEETWLAVQIFGRPASDCVSPDIATKSSLDVSEAKLTGMEAELKTQEATINDTSPSEPAYSGDVTAYNALAAAYNALLAETKENISTYNAAVETYNTCLGK